MISNIGMRRQWRALVRRASEQPVTVGGFVFTMALLLVGVAAVVSANNLLFLILAAMLSTLMVSGLISRLSLAGLQLDCVLPEHIAARRKFAGRILVRNAKRWLPSFSVHLGGSEDTVLTTLYFPVIPGGAILEDTIEVLFQKRGIYRESGFLFSTSFPFGFLERRAHVTLRRDVLVYPCLDPQPGFEDLLAAVRGEMETQWRGRGHDFYRIRPYVAFESARHVDWKATAHTGDLQVREFAREQDRVLEIFLDLDAGPEDQAWFEQAVDACAYLVWAVGSRGARVRFRTQSYDCSVPEMGDAYTILRYLAMVTPRRGKLESGPQDDNSYQLVFTAGDPEAVIEAGWAQARILGPGAFPSGSGAELAARTR